MLRTRQEWFDYCLNRGTSGDMVFDVLKDWKEDRAATQDKLKDVLFLLSPGFTENDVFEARKMLESLIAPPPAQQG